MSGSQGFAGSPRTTDYKKRLSTKPNETAMFNEDIVTSAKIMCSASRLVLSFIAYFRNPSYLNLVDRGYDILLRNL